MKIRKHAFIFTIGLLSIALGGCASQQQRVPVNTNSIVQLENLNQQNSPTAAAGSNQIRLRGLKEAALALGAQSGLAWRAAQINIITTKQAQNLRTIFNFDALILNHSVLPPVLVETSNTLNLDSPDTIRTSSETYKIVENARFVTAPPTWQDYLYMNYKKPKIPDNTLLPKNPEEQALWQKYVQIGWVNGARQADTIYAENLARLKRDFQGMVLYRRLLAEHMVTPPYVATTDLGVTGDSHQLNIGDKILRISALPTLQTNSQAWKPILVNAPQSP